MANCYCETYSVSFNWCFANLNSYRFHATFHIPIPLESKAENTFVLKNKIQTALNKLTLFSWYCHIIKSFFFV